MPAYMFFIRKQTESAKTLSPEVHEKFLKGCETYIGRLKEQGKLIAAQPIERAGTILSKSVNNWIEAPLHEHTEVIGGFYHILADNLAEAIDIARANPEFEYNPGTRIEIRPLKMKEETTGYLYPTRS